MKSTQKAMGTQGMMTNSWREQASREKFNEQMSRSFRSEQGGEWH